MRVLLGAAVTSMAFTPVKLTVVKGVVELGASCGETQCGVDSGRYDLVSGACH